MDTIILDNSEIETVIIRISEFPESSRKWDDITDKPAVIAAGATIQEALEQIGLENVPAEIISLQEVTTILNEDVTDIKSEQITQNEAIATKVDKVTGKSLILDSEIARLSTVTNQDISNLVVKDGTKVLSDINFSTAKDTKLSGIDTGAQVNAIDSITTTGTSGAATLVGKVLNIPQYSGGGGGGSTDWNDITNKPIVIGAGATQSDARAAIGAGTSNLTLGLTNTTAKAGDYTPSMSDVTGLNTALSNKVDKVAGKSLINDTEITRLTGIATGATANDTDANLKNTDNHTNGIINKVFTAVLLAKINSITEIFTTALKTAYDNAVTWISTNGANLINHLSATNNPHNVTKTQVGLSNVDNTSDVNKPVSTAQSTALGLKVDKVTGKSLISDSEITRLSTVVNQTIPVTSVAGKTGAVTLGKVDVGLGSVDNIADAAKEVLSATKLLTARNINGVAFDGTANITVADSTKIPTSEKGANSGVATLDSGGKIPSSQLPAIAITDTFPVASQAAMLALTAQVGDVAIRSDISKTFILRVEPATTLANWSELLNPTDAVTSVAGRTGVVTLVKADVGLGSVNDTPDTAKPVSTAQQTALDLKANIASPTFTGTPVIPSDTQPLSVLSQSGATTGQSVKWNGSAWVPYTPSGGGTTIKASTTLNSTDINTNKYKDITVTGAAVGDLVEVVKKYYQSGGNILFFLNAEVTATNTVRIYISVILGQTFTEGNTFIVSSALPFFPVTPTVNLVVFK